METRKLPIALFNGTVVTTNGTYKIDDIDLNIAIKLLKEHGYISAIGHSATAELMSEILGVEVPKNRIHFVQEVDQLAIVFKLKVRPAEGVILTKEELLDIGYDLKIMKRLK